MHKPRYFLLLSVFVLGLGCYMVVGGNAIEQNDWPMYLGMTCLVIAICVAALIESLEIQRKRIDKLEQLLSEKQSPAAADGGRVAGS